MKYHPACEIFPALEGEAFDELVEDIRVRGQRERILLTEEGEILDGRNRYRACQRLGIEPLTKIWRPRNGESALSVAVSLNIKRRHLDATARAVLGDRLIALFEAEARERQRQAGKQYGRGQSDEKLTEKIPEAIKGEARVQAAAVVRVNPHYISDVAALRAGTPAIYDRIVRQELTLTAARREAQRAKATQAAKLPSNKYRIFLADPPWKYGDQLTEDYGPTRFHYSPMTLAELCSLPIADLAEANAVLFLWVTAPLLFDCAAPVVKAWGFSYKAQFVWDKVKHNMGHYNSVRHELLLVCTRGSCTPDVPKLYDSVVTIERTTHSAKPPEFRQMIDTLYPYGRRIELFARDRATGWDVWGNQGACLSVPAAG